MKAIICHAYGPPENLSNEEVEIPKINANDVLIQVAACSVNFPDTLIIQGLYQFKPPFPFSPGSDVAGIVHQVGDNVKNVKVGDEVVAMCGFGGFAEYVAVNKNMVFSKPLKMDMLQASSFLLAYGTSYHALLDRAKLQKGETILILGASGGVGLTAVELSHLMGATVIAAASSDEKLDLCKEYGAVHTINYTTENLKEKINEITNGKGVDVVYDPVGGDLSELALRAMAWEGRYLVVGFASGHIPKIPLNLPLLKGCQIVGVFWGAFAQKFPEQNFEQVAQLIRWFDNKSLHPHISKVFALEEAPAALRQMMERKVSGKVVIKMKSFNKVS